MRNTLPCVLALLLLAPAIASVIRVDDVKGKKILGRMLDEGTGKKGEVHFWYGRELTPIRGPITQVQNGMAVVELESDVPVHPGDFLVDRDWYTVIRLLDLGGDIKAVQKSLAGVGGETAFPGIETNDLETFKGRMISAIAGRTAMVEKQGKNNDESSLAFLYLTTADYHFKFESDYKRAYQFYLKGLSKSPGFATMQVRALAKAGDCQLNLKNPADAKDFYGKALDLMKKDPAFYSGDIKVIEKRLELLGKNAETAPPAPKDNAGLRQKLVATARSLVDTSWPSGAEYKGKSFLFDCQGVTARVYWEYGIDLTRDYGKPEMQNMKGGVPIIFATYKNLGKIHYNKIPKAGDLVFFDNTWDYNGNRRWDDTFTHIGLVETVDPDGTISVIHHCSRGIKQYKMNLNKPTVYQDESGKVLNSFIRRNSSDDPAGTSYVLGNYFSGFANAAD